MIEPTESESKEECDLFIDAMKSIAEEAAKKPETVKTAPHTTRVRRLDEVGAARKPSCAGSRLPAKRSRGLNEESKRRTGNCQAKIPFKAHI